MFHFGQRCSSISPTNQLASSWFSKKVQSLKNSNNFQIKIFIETLLLDKPIKTDWLSQSIVIYTALALQIDCFVIYIHILMSFPLLCTSEIVNTQETSSSFHLQAQLTKKELNFFSFSYFFLVRNNYICFRLDTPFDILQWSIRWLRQEWSVWFGWQGVIPWGFCNSFRLFKTFLKNF